MYQLKGKLAQNIYCLKYIISKMRAHGNPTPQLSWPSIIEIIFHSQWDICMHFCGWAQNTICRINWQVYFQCIPKLQFPTSRMQLSTKRSAVILTGRLTEEGDKKNVEKGPSWPSMANIHPRILKSPKKPSLTQQDLPPSFLYAA